MGRLPLWAFEYMWMACPICLSCDRQYTWFAACRARFRLGSRIEMSNAMMPMTTSSSTSVKARLDVWDMSYLQPKKRDV
jgi:hypothetical protein